MLKKVDVSFNLLSIIFFFIPFPTIIISMADFLINLVGPLPQGDLLVLGALFVVYSFIFYVAAQIFLRVFAHVAGRTETDLDDRILAKINKLVMVLAFLTSGLLALDYSYPHLYVLGVPLPKIYEVSILIVIAVMINRVVHEILSWYGREVAPKTESKLDEEILPLLNTVSKIFIFGVFALFIMGQLGIEIGPLLAGLGIAGLAVGLALQDTLSNFFAGIHLLTDRPFKEGDLIGVDATTTGTIAKIGWRSTKIRTPDNNFVIIPNAKLAQSVVTNYFAPNQRAQFVGEIGVSYNSDVELVERTIYDTLKAVQETNESCSKTDEPWVRLDRFGDFALTFKYGFFATRYDKRFEVVKQFNKDLFRAFKSKGIEIPYPVMTVVNGNTGPSMPTKPPALSADIKLPEPQLTFETQPIRAPEPAVNPENSLPSPPMEQKLQFEFNDKPLSPEASVPDDVAEPSETEPKLDKSRVAQLLEEIKGPKLPDFRDEPQLEADDAKVNEAIEDTFTSRRGDRKAKKPEPRKDEKSKSASSERKRKFIEELRKKMEEDFE